MQRLLTRVLLAGAALAAGSPVSADPPRPTIVVRPVPQQTGTPESPTVPAQPVFVIDRFARAEANFMALRDGRLSTHDLTPQELEDVLELDRRLLGNLPYARTPEQQCVEDEVRRNGGRPSELAWRVIDLKCRETGG